VRATTTIAVRVDLSRHLLVLERRGEPVFRTRAATGSAASPTPPGDYVVTDRVPFSAGSYLGSFAFGISGIQPSLPPGWSGGDQLAIHGTDQPWSIGRSTSAGCLRVSESALARLRPLLRQGTPVVIEP
jgi:lipoprotein-anchoring transpeptidase ErfK/SrfK